MNEIISTSKVARLDGFLTGIVSLNGNINDYYAGAFVLKDTHENNLERHLINYYQDRCKIILSSNKVELKFSELEQNIQQFIAENILGYQVKHFDYNSINNRKKYLSFKILDMVEFLLPNFDQTSYATKKAIKIEGIIENSNAKETFFCIPFNHHYLILLFSSPSTRKADSPKGNPP